MGYQEVYGDLEDFANELKASKAKKAWFRITDEAAEFQAEVPTKLEDGTTSTEKKKVTRLVSKITLTALGYLTSSDAEVKAMSTSSTPPKPDSQLLFSAIIAQKDCIDQQDVVEFEKEKDSAWKQIIKQVKDIWDGAFFEGVGSIII